MCRVLSSVEKVGLSAAGSGSFLLPGGTGRAIAIRRDAFRVVYSILPEALRPHGFHLSGAKQYFIFYYSTVSPFTQDRIVNFCIVKNHAVPALIGPAAGMGKARADP